MKKIAIVGAGPAGLGCGHELLSTKQKNASIVILEKNDRVGGLARTYEYNGHYFDLGPHRFYTKNKEILSLWKHVLGKDFKTIPRQTRILYRKKLYAYPIQIADVIVKLGIIQSIICVASYLQAKIFYSSKNPKTFEQWTIKHFGKRLYEMFFKTYTEKVWGISCKKIGSEWASQRIKNLSMFSLLLNATPLLKKRKIKSLIDIFYYPSRGAGMMYEALAKKIRKNGGTILCNATVTRVLHKDNKITDITYMSGKKTIPVAIDFLFTSMPITDLIRTLSPKPPKQVMDAAKKLFFRDHITVNIVVNKKDIFPDNWVYVHSPDIAIARIANYNNFGKEQRKTTALSLEYFTFANDKISQRTDDDLVEFAKNEIVNTGLVKKSDIVNAFVIREKDAYPTYYLGYQKYFLLLKNYLSRFTNLQSIGRAGMYKYNNMDHALLSGIYAARNFLHKANYDIWDINEDAAYLEEIKK